MIVAVDVGGTKTLVSSFASDGQPGEEFRFATPQQQNDFVMELLDVLHRQYPADKTDVISIALPGRVLPDGTLAWAGNLPWLNLDLKSILRQHYNCPIFIQNDAKLAGLAETNALSPVPNLCLYVTIGTGIGTGIFINGRLHAALNGSEGGHMAFEHDGTWASWESFASGHAIHKRYHTLAKDIHNSADWKKIAHDIAVGLLACIPLLEPDQIIIGGGVGAHFDRYADFLKSELSAHLPTHIDVPIITEAKHPEEAVIYGCYYNAVHQLAA